ncbi:hypothetical protein KPL70_022387 [Citrus sinensis]|uniref:DUF761 domain-containing protein n=1 Tax=Citrus clementina TaxID=85681 RepID=V4SG94_CITCL|nr:uncharacterized protein LOC18034416 [Citrus x clementina]XP_006487063.2 uncharacterized protein LOC102624355 [Citrus sinensis]ESR36051.1 hypothetical protein CICLE_v10030001mg [Citrus x clementina]KAH9655644.1 hypothetical protein KPL70_022387 [Citrus sinensis]
MKNKASAFLKQVLCFLTSVAKSKSMAIKNKTSAAKARLIMFSLMKSKKVLVGSISKKIHGLLGHPTDKDADNIHDGDQSKAIVPYNAAAAVGALVTEPQSSSICSQLLLQDAEDDDDKYPDLRHSLFDDEEFEFEDEGNGSIIDMVRNSKEEGEDFSLEEEIDHVADLFIKRFHRQMHLQKLASFKRFQEMLARGV